jgi:4-alpha-glucanotransferase
MPLHPKKCIYSTSYHDQLNTNKWWLQPKEDTFQYKYIMNMPLHPKKCIYSTSYHDQLNTNKWWLQPKEYIPIQIYLEHTIAP